MSLGFILASSIYRVDNKKLTPKRVSKSAVQVSGGRPQLREIIHRLQDGTRRPCLHSVVSPVVNKCRVGKKKVVLFDESTYTEEMIEEKTAEFRDNNPQAPRSHAKRRTCKRLESKPKPMKFDKKGFKVSNGSNGRRVMKNAAGVKFKGVPNKYGC